jgi:hypothetical protein
MRENFENFGAGSSGNIIAEDHILPNPSCPGCINGNYKITGSK